MTREAIAQLIGWSWIIWTIGFINVGAMVPQFIKLIKTRETKGLSMGMIGIYLGIQIAFALEGYFNHNEMLRVCMGLSAVMSLVVMLTARIIRRRYEQ